MTLKIKIYIAKSLLSIEVNAVAGQTELLIYFYCKYMYFGEGSEIQLFGVGG